MMLIIIKENNLITKKLLYKYPIDIYKHSLNRKIDINLKEKILFEIEIDKSIKEDYYLIFLHLKIYQEYICE